MRKGLIWPLLAVPLLALMPAARAAALQRVRGAIESVAPDHIIVQDRTGARVNVHLSDPLTVLIVTPLDGSGVRVGRAAAVVVKQARDGSLVAVQVLALPDSLVDGRDGGEIWDLRPDNRMLVGEIASTGRRNGTAELTISGREGTKVVALPADTPVALVQMAARSDLKVGEAVVLVGFISPDGSVSADRVVVSPKATADPTPSG
ncbi:MAG: hypothetical protein U1E70_02170 [Acetobacteraceae bacterium]